MGKKSENSHLREIWAIVLAAIAVILLLSLISYDPKDWPNSSVTGGARPTNFIGPVGAWLAWVTFQTFGIGAYVLMVLLAVIGALLMLQHEAPWRGKIGAGSLLLLASCCLMHVAGFRPLVDRLGLPDSAGGFVGFFLGGFFQSIVGKPGTWIIFGACYVISLILLINFRPSYWVALIVTGTQDFWAAARSSSKPDIKKEMKDKERDIRVKEYELEREMAKKEKEAKKIEKIEKVEKVEKVEGETKPPPEPKFADYTVSRPAKGSAAEAAAEVKPSLVEKLAEKLSSKKPKVEEEDPDPAEAAAAIAAVTPKPKREKAVEAEAGLLGGASAGTGEEFVLPPMELLAMPTAQTQRNVMDDLKTSAKVLKDTVLEFGLEVESGDVTKGPTVTLFELHPAAGVRVEKIAALSSNIAMAMRAEKVRILAPVPGKGTVGVEIPNMTRTTVFLRDMLESDEWRNTTKSIPIALGRDVKGHPIIGDLAGMPHMLIAGATGSGKTVCVNAILASLLYKFTAEDLRLVLIDPKMVEMQHYNALPHLIVPVVTDSKKVPLALGWVIREMEKRFQIFAKEGVRNISGFNSRPKKQPKPVVKVTDTTKPAEENAEKPPEPKEEQELLKIEVPRDFDLVIPEKLPFIVVVVDELADLMATVGKDVEMAIARLTALGRAAGIHLIVATQRPSVNVVTGVIKANIPARVAFQVASMQDSRVILDTPGAEKLLGKGDMLYEPGSGKGIRAQGVLVLDKEINDIVEFIGNHAKPKFEPELAKKLTFGSTTLPDNEASEEDEELLEQCIEVIRQTNRASVSVLQRRLRIGYTRAARIMDLLEERGIVGPNKGAEPREILMDLDDKVSAE